MDNLLQVAHCKLLCNVSQTYSSVYVIQFPSSPYTPTTIQREYIGLRQILPRPIRKMKSLHDYRIRGQYLPSSNLIKFTAPSSVPV